jgi:hypothetical protein
MASDFARNRIGAAPVGDQEVGPAVAVEVAGSAAGRRHGAVDRQLRRRIQDERGELVGRARGRRVGDDHLIGAGVDDAHAVRQAVARDVIDGDAGADRGQPGADLLVGRVDDPDVVHGLLVVPGRQGDRLLLELVLRGGLGAAAGTAARDRGLGAEHQRGRDDDCQETWTQST